MDIEKIQQLIKSTLSVERYEHTLRVTETAIHLAEQYNSNLEDVTIAALFHDYAKEFTYERLRLLIKQYDLPEELYDYHVELWHGPVAAKLIEDQYKVTEESVTNAIYYHTTGRAGMSLVELIVFVADYIEPGRYFPGIEEVRKDAEQSIVLAARNALKNTIVFLLNKHVTIHPDTFLAYNDLTKKIGVK